MSYIDLCTELTPAQESIKKETNKFARDVLRPAAIELDSMDPLSVIQSGLYRDTLRKGYELGYHTIFIPDTWGGLGLDPLEIHIVLEELAWGSVDFAVSLGVTCFPAFFATMVPNDKLIDEIIVPFCENKDATIIGCWGITEPDHGSDQLSVGAPWFHDAKITGQCHARLEGDAYVITGQKSAWVSNGSVASHCMAYINIDPSMGLAGGGIGIIPLHLPGVRRGAPLNKMGQRALNQGEIYFDNVRVPREYMIVEPDSYEPMLDLTLATANAGMGAMFTGVARAAYELALEYAKQRVQGGKVLFEHQLIRHKLFQMFTKVEAARALSRAAFIYNLNNTPPLSRYSIAAKTYCTQVAFEVANDAMQIFGGNGLSKEYPIEKIFRDARAGLVEDGANDTLMIIAAQEL
jgi:alkylation response protein AidB-like acyl-CoA dehydrogenase